MAGALLQALKDARVRRASLITRLQTAIRFGEEGFSIALAPRPASSQAARSARLPQRGRSGSASPSLWRANLRQAFAWK